MNKEQAVKPYRPKSFREWESWALWPLLAIQRLPKYVRFTRYTSFLNCLVKNTLLLLWSFLLVLLHFIYWFRAHFFIALIVSVIHRTFTDVYIYKARKEEFIRPRLRVDILPPSDFRSVKEQKGKTISVFLSFLVAIVYF